MKEIKICNFIDGCGGCPFVDSCGLDFPTKRSKENWIKEISNEIEKLEILLDKIKNI